MTLWEPAMGVVVSFWSKKTNVGHHVPNSFIALTFGLSRTVF